MPPRKPTGAGVPNDAETRFNQLSDYFKTNDASVEGVLHWDIKADRLQAAVLGMLAAGGGLMFGLTRDGSSMSVTVYLDEGKERKYIEDSIDFDDFMETIIGVSARIRDDKAARELNGRAHGAK